MRFLGRLRPELIRVGVPWRTFDATVTGLVEVLAEAGELPAGAPGDAVRAIVAREAEASTALLEIHVGVPHARLSGLGQPVVSLAASAAGLYEPVPTVPIHIVALVLSPTNATTTHLETLAEVATLLRSGPLRAGLLAARDGTDALAALHAHARAMP